VNKYKLQIPTGEEHLGFVGDNAVEVREFEVTDSNLFDFDFKLDIESKGDKGIIDLDKAVESDRVILTWEILREHLPRDGILAVQLRAFDDNGEIWHSEVSNRFVVYGSINAPDAFPPPLPSEFEQMEERVTAAKNATVEAAAQVAADKSDVAADKQTAIEKAAEALQSATDALASANRAELSEDNAANSETAAYSAMQTATQAMSDLLAMLGDSVATLTNGTLTPSQIPPLSINDVFEVEDEEEMLDLPAQQGDVALIITDDIVSDSFMLATDDPTQAENWKKLGVSYVSDAGHAETATEAENANKINNHRFVTMSESQYETAVLEDNTLYAVYPDEEV
jgi:hypothetical protein